MLVYSDAVVINNDLHLYGGQSVAFDLRWDIIAVVRARCRMDDTLHRCSPNTVVDVHCDAKESRTAVYASMLISNMMKKLNLLCSLNLFCI